VDGDPVSTDLYENVSPGVDKEKEAEQAGKQGRVRGLRLPEEDRGRDTGLLLPEPVLCGDGEGDPGSADVRVVQHGTPHVGGVS
jgi:hypothetical protein